MTKQSFILSTLLIIQAPIVSAVETASEARLDEVAAKGRMVMPFNLEKTLHVFSKTKQGGVQQVIVKDPSNKAQISLIKTHLSKIYADFKTQDYSDPEKIHGADMPGLRALKNAKSGALSLQYRELSRGAEITYTAKKPELVKAIHQWFDAQLSDHARHSSMHRSHHMMHKQQKIKP